MKKWASNVINIHEGLKQIEDNEIIRFLEIGVPVYCVNVIGDSWAVDEEKDLRIVENLILKAKRK